MYEANGIKFESFGAAIKSADATKTNVYLVLPDGSKVSRWSPAPPASAKRQRRYLDQKAAYEAQERMLAAQAAKRAG